jgi:hypothetical protein
MTVDSMNINSAKVKIYGIFAIVIDRRKNKKISVYKLTGKEFFLETILSVIVV